MLFEPSREPQSTWQMKKQSEKMDARAANDMASKEAKKWDSTAKLYQLEGKDTLSSNGTAKQWTAYFAVREDPENSPSKKHSKKFVVLMLGGQAKYYRGIRRKIFCTLRISEL